MSRELEEAVKHMTISEVLLEVAIALQETHHMDVARELRKNADKHQNICVELLNGGIEPTLRDFELTLRGKK